MSQWVERLKKELHKKDFGKLAILNWNILLEGRGENQ